MHIPDGDPRCVTVCCSQCATPAGFAIPFFPGTLVAAVCHRCLRKLLDEAEKVEEAGG